jgi:predicted metal-binding membrane protein
MSNEQVIGMDAARWAMKSGNYGLGAMWVLALLLLVPGIIFGSWILIGIGLIVAIPTAIAQYRHHQNRKMWEQPPQ